MQLRFISGGAHLVSHRCSVHRHFNVFHCLLFVGLWKKTMTIKKTPQNHETTGTRKASNHSPTKSCQEIPVAETCTIRIASAVDTSLVDAWQLQDLLTVRDFFSIQLHGMGPGHGWDGSLLLGGSSNLLDRLISFLHCQWGQTYTPRSVTKPLKMHGWKSIFLLGW